MRGAVAEDGNEPLLPLGLLAEVGNGSEEGTSLGVETVIDTGFDGELTLPSETIQRLGYPYAGRTLADGSEIQLDYHEGRVLWRQIAVISAEGQPLIGMALLRGSRLSLEAVPGGEITISELRGASPSGPPPVTCRKAFELRLLHSDGGVSSKCEPDR